MAEAYNKHQAKLREIRMFQRYKFCIILLITAISLPAGHFSFLHLSSNFHPITAGEAYRSAQMSGENLESHIQKYDIKSVLNLRGSEANTPWYRDEIRVSEKNRVAHYDIALSAEREPSPQDVRKLIEIFQEAPRPILIHCKAGSDRSGLVAAMWKVMVNKESKAEAEKQLSLKFGHLPFGKTNAMDNFFAKWKPELN